MIVDRLLRQLNQLDHQIVVALLGVTGALNYWAPLQPFLGMASLALLLATLAIRLRGGNRRPLPRPA